MKTISTNLCDASFAYYCHSKHYREAAAWRRWQVKSISRVGKHLLGLIVCSLVSIPWRIITDLLYTKYKLNYHAKAAPEGSLPQSHNYLCSLLCQPENNWYNWLSYGTRFFFFIVPRVELKSQSYEHSDFHAGNKLAAACKAVVGTGTQEYHNCSFKYNALF